MTGSLQRSLVALSPGKSRYRTYDVLAGQSAIYIPDTQSAVRGNVEGTDKSSCFMVSEQTLYPSNRRLRFILVHLLPFLHLCACLTIALAHLESAWRYMFLIDVPMSVVVGAISYNFDHPLLLFGTLGTLWWYLLSRAAEMFFRRSPARATPNSR
jgi:hypothetical protein